MGLGLYAACIFVLSRFMGDFHVATIVITWENRFSTPQGFPVDREWDELHAFFGLIEEAVEHDRLGLMSLALTGKWECVMVFHTRDADEFSKRLNELPRQGHPYPLQIEKRDDPAWACFTAISKGSRKTSLSSRQPRWTGPWLRASTGFPPSWASPMPPCGSQPASASRWTAPPER